MEAETQCGYAAFLRSRGLPGDAERARELAAMAAATSDSRGLGGLCTRATALMNQGG
jgi:hypothetical protein